MTLNGRKIKNYFKKYSFSRISDQEFDKLVRESMKGLNDRALAKTLIDPNDCIRQPKMITGLKAKDFGGAEANYRKGKDGYIRYIPKVVTILNFTLNEIVIYQCVFDPTKEIALNESTFAVFYEHVVSIETITDSRGDTTYSTVEKLMNKIPVIKNFIEGELNHVNVSKKFVLSTQGNTSIEIKLSDYEVVDEIGGQFRTSDVDNVIRAVRTALNDKKSRN
ncbi:hypothetical protein [uncultured Kordia sp.]|uniref:hypothetical protein n=1 Tax=uncultured Kordia sp. TaxID=507699 RepID=UPI0026193FC1|nr:hypothetical protein [uncultured Kordia sp.]